MVKISKKELIDLVMKALDFPKKKYKNTSSLNNSENWDSMGHLNILILLNKKLLGKAKNISELSNANSIEKITKILNKKKLIK